MLIILLQRPTPYLRIWLEFGSPDMAQEFTNNSIEINKHEPAAAHDDPAYGKGPLPCYVPFRKIFDVVHLTPCARVFETGMEHSVCTYKQITCDIEMFSCSNRSSKFDVAIALSELSLPLVY